MHFRVIMDSIVHEIVSIGIPVCGSLAGVYLGAILTDRRNSNNRAMYLDSFWLELNDIRSEIQVILRCLLSEFEKPFKNSYTNPQSIDWAYINELQSKIGADIPFPLRKALKSIKVHDSVSKTILYQRKEILFNPNKVNLFNQLTSRSIIETAKLFYIICKLLESKERFSLGDDLSVIDMMKSSFNYLSETERPSSDMVKKIYATSPRTNE